MGWIFPAYPENWTALRQIVLDRDGHRCKRCGSSSRPLHVDHTISLSRGGTNSLDNLQTLCLRCHSLKHPHMAARYSANDLVVGKIGLIGFFALVFGIAAFFMGLFDILNPTLKPSAPWTPGAPLPPLVYATNFPEPLTMFTGLLVFVIGIIGLVFDSPRKRRKIFGTSARSSLDIEPSRLNAHSRQNAAHEGESVLRCPSCGSAISSGLMVCTACGWMP